jgi:hypothetical protein
MRSHSKHFGVVVGSFQEDLTIVIHDPPLDYQGISPALMMIQRCSPRESNG